MKNSDKIEVRGVRVNNLRNIDLDIQKNKLTVITGLSGSGKSSLAFDTIYAEGQRRYVESLSAYARQFMGRLRKPDVDRISGLSPAIAIEQRTNSSNPRSTVGTSTEIYEYMKLLFSRVGHTFSPISGVEVKSHQVGDVVDFIFSQVRKNIYILAPLIVPEDRTLEEHLEILLQQGFNRLIINDKPIRIEDCLKDDSIKKSDKIRIMVDRLKVNEKTQDLVGQISDSVQTALYEGKDNCIILVDDKGDFSEHHFSSRFEADGMTFEQPSVHLFSFNNPYGACCECEGFGTIIGIDENLVIPNKSLSLYDNAVACWKGEKMSAWRDAVIRNSRKSNFPIYTPYNQLSEEHKDMLWKGCRYFQGINDFFKEVESQSYKIQYRVMMSRYRGKTICPKCKGSRLTEAAQYVKVGGKNINELVSMPLDKLKDFFDNLTLPEAEQSVAERLLLEIRHRLDFLTDVGLGYLTLNRTSSTLSGGESQRINLATSLGSSLVGSTYILDEPSIGLHSRDTQRLIKVLKHLRDIGNTVIVVEHEEEIIRNADEIIDIGPYAGEFGGELVFQGDIKTMMKKGDTLTAKYMSGEMKIEIPKIRRKWNNYILFRHCSENNLKDIDVKIPIGVMTVITGVSGSGKSTLVNNIIYPELKSLFDGIIDRRGIFDNITVTTNQLQAVEYINQTPIGRSSRSNPVTYVKAFDDIRQLFAEQKLAKMRGYKPGYFSFNVEGGRCDNCMGEGRLKVEMQFMADVYLQCDVCNGQRYKEEALEVKFMDKNINDILNMSIDEALEYFSKPNDFSSITERIIMKLKPLQDVGLGYLKMGQPSSTLSGGEAQRIKLASFLVSGYNEKPTLFIFDEPTTGLHFHDVKKLLAAFNALIKNGHSIVVIEHDADVIKSADWIIDLGPEGGELGGNIVFEGTPEDILKCDASYTAAVLRRVMKK